MDGAIIIINQARNIRDALSMIKLMAMAAIISYLEQSTKGTGAAA